MKQFSQKMPNFDSGVHEIGHNLADEFLHEGTAFGTYEYHQQGLQSNKHGDVYPSEKNTLAIINDAYNRKSMRIL